MGRDPRLEVALIASAVNFGRKSVSWFSERIGGTQRRHDRADLGGEDIVRLLTQALYSYYYSVSGPRLIAEVESLRQQAANNDITSALVAANPSTGRWEGGWVLRGETRHKAILTVEKDGLTLSVEKERVREARQHAVAFQPEHVEVQTPHHSMNRSTGFYVAHSDADFDYDARVSRFYINCRPEDAPAVLFRTISLLNELAVPFDIKVAKNARQFYRSDVVVLYVYQDHLSHIWRDLGAMIGSLPFPLRDSLPAMVRRMAPGVGLAEDPADGQSFGLSRCRMIATGLVRVRDPDVEARLHAIEAEFAAHGTDLDCPYAISAQRPVYADL